MHPSAFLAAVCTWDLCTTPAQSRAGSEDENRLCPLVASLTYAT